MTGTPFPLPGTGEVVTIATAPGAGPGYWAGAPGVAAHPDGGFVVAYRVRNGHDGVDENVIALAPDGVTLTEVSRFPATRFEGGRWVERPAIVELPDGSWRLYVCVGGPASKMWWVEMIDARSLDELATAPSTRTLELDDLHAVKDPIVTHVGGDVPGEGVWHAWPTIHLLDEPGDEDRMNSAYATSVDGLEWTWHGTVLEGRAGEWDARGARLTSILPDGRAAYDGRASAAENWFEKSGIAVPDDDGIRFNGTGGPIADLRYLTVMPLDDGGYRLWYEARLDDESHELRTELISPSPPAAAESP
ncbi:hypothetical protein BH11ACT3_BH11ACT3_03760 [soil metagenome]